MDTHQGSFDVIVIGGGAAGMMAAGQAARRKKRVLIIEKNRTFGEKLKLTGNGRCNITNAEFEPGAFLEHYGTGKEFLFSPFAQFGVKDSFSFFESIGLPLVVQAGSRVFPASERATDVVLALRKHLEKAGVECKTGCAVRRLVHQDRLVTGVETDVGVLCAKSFILATGGLSHPETGSTGDGFLWLKELGHSITHPAPSVVPLEVSDEWVKMLRGVSLPIMKITFFLDGKKQFSKAGTVLFTHFGLSGPLILNSASKVKDLLQNGQVTAQIDAFPDTDLGALDRNAVSVFDSNKNKTLKTVLKDIAPPGTSSGVQTLLADIDLDSKVHSISKEDRKRIVSLLKALPVTITGLMGYDRAVVSDGGVSLSEIDTRTMRSKLFSNLYIVGDLLNVSRSSGGFSLQLCWTTGYVAGNCA
ncbi:MAG: aminoacetone oxidase family FAD-binding enzyme [Chloroflexi bacterium]|nr:aminoacetone oxidase family FAD-binding enzyme [Chloroflexota bacterium]